MKFIIKTLTPCLAAVLLAGTGTSNATIVSVNGDISTGFMAVFNNAGGPIGSQGSFVFDSPWGIADVKSTPGSTSIVLEPNYNTYGDPTVATGDSFWRDNNGAGPGGNKWMVASSYAAKPAANFPDGICNFTAQVSAYSFTSGYTVKAFVKGFDSNGSFISEVISPALAASSQINLVYDFADVLTNELVEVASVQYGFEVQGLNANSAFPQGSATVISNAATPIVYGIPNPGFEQGGFQWVFAQENGHTLEYPVDGGNPGGYAKIDSTSASGGYAVLVANGGNQLSLEALSLTAGQKYTFAMDMKIIAGANIGGFKVDFVPSGSTGDMYPTPSTTPGEWSTYSFAVPIPLGTIGLKLVPLWGPGSIVGYDNVRVAGPFAASATTVASNVKISWPSVTGRTYQVRKSNNLVNWAPFGASTPGNGSTFTVTDPVGAPGKSFFQVIETTP